MLAHLCSPPPFPALHIVKQANGPVLIRIVSLWNEYKMRGKLWVPKKCTNALENIAKVYVERLARNNNLLALKAWTAGNLFVDYPVEFVRGIERQVKCFR